MLFKVCEIKINEFCSVGGDCGGGEGDGGGGGGNGGGGGDGNPGGGKGEGGGGGGGGEGGTVLTPQSRQSVPNAQ